MQDSSFCTVLCVMPSRACHLIGPEVSTSQMKAWTTWGKVASVSRNAALVAAGYEMDETVQEKRRCKMVRRLLLTTLLAQAVIWVTLSAPGTAQPPCAAQDMDGTWINTDLQTGGLIKLDLDFPCYGTGGRQLHVHVNREQLASIHARGCRAHSPLGAREKAGHPAAVQGPVAGLLQPRLREGKCSRA